MSKAGKRGLLIEEIDVQFKAIHFPDCVSKVGTGRKVPLSDAGLAWLEWAGIRPGMKGPVCPKNPVEAGETKRLGLLVFKEDSWPQDILRHSYGSYQNAIIRDLA